MHQWIRATADRDRERAQALEAELIEVFIGRLIPNMFSDTLRLLAIVLAHEPVHDEFPLRTEDVPDHLRRENLMGEVIRQTAGVISLVSWGSPQNAVRVVMNPQFSTVRPIVNNREALLDAVREELRLRGVQS